MNSMEIPADAIEIAEDGSEQVRVGEHDRNGARGVELHRVADDKVFTQLRRVHRTHQLRN